MRIATNVRAMNTHRSYTMNNNKAAKSSERLSSGYKINRAGDDAAGLAISEKMRSQIRGLNMASKNSQDAISLVQTAEGALQEVHSMLQRMNEIANQSATGTNQSIDRNALNAEFQQLKEEINQIGDQTTFNNMKLFDGSIGAGEKSLNNGVKVMDAFATNGTVSAILKGVTSQAKAVNIEIGTVDADTGEFTADTTVTASSVVRVTSVDEDGNATIKDLKASDVFKDATGNGVTAPVANSKFSVDLSGAGLGAFEVTTAATAVSADDLATAVAGLSGGLTATPGSGSGSLKIQVGALENETLDISIQEISTSTLNLDDSKIDSQDEAASAITTSRDAINKVSSQRAALGAAQNRLEYKIANLDASSENLSAAESRIRDVDLASEMTTFTKNNILAQAATAMLAQANAAPQNVLQLLS